MVEKAESAVNSEKTVERQLGEDPITFIERLVAMGMDKAEATAYVEGNLDEIYHADKQYLFQDPERSGDRAYYYHNPNHELIPYRVGDWMIQHSDGPRMDVLRWIELRNLIHASKPVREKVAELLREGFSPRYVSDMLNTYVEDGARTWAHGLLCDVATAEECGQMTNDGPGIPDSHRMACTIYRAPEGHYFARGNGGSDTIFRDNWYFAESHDPVIVLVDEEWANRCSGEEVNEHRRPKESAWDYYERLTAQGMSKDEAIDVITHELTRMIAYDGSKIYYEYDDLRTDRLYVLDGDGEFSEYTKGEWVVEIEQGFYVDITVVSELEDLPDYMDTDVYDKLEIYLREGMSPKRASEVLSIDVKDGDNTWVDGLLCNVATAEELGESCSKVDDVYNFDYYHATIYRAPEGHYFAVGSGGARSMFGMDSLNGNSSWGQSNVTILLSESDAMEMLGRRSEEAGQDDDSDYC